MIQAALPLQPIREFRRQRSEFDRFFAVVIRTKGRDLSMLLIDLKGVKHMRLPAIRGVIDRRVLVNFRIDPTVLNSVCPAPFRPQVINGFGVAGICLIRLRNLRLQFAPRFLGISSENAAHRIAVEWNDEGKTKTGVFIPRRDTSSPLVAFAGGRIFPGVHHFARFDVQESVDHYQIAMNSDDESAHVKVVGKTTSELPADSVFSSVKECSKFFENGSLGYSPANTARQFDGLELRTRDWHVEPLAVTEVESSFFDDAKTFPKGSVTFDNALLMSNIDHEWHSRKTLCCD